MFDFLRKKLLIKKQKDEFYNRYFENIKRQIANEAIQANIFMQFIQNINNSYSKVTYKGKTLWVSFNNADISLALYLLADKFYEESKSN